ncbi:sodium Bile acid symporter family [Actinidia rufa]|uniref:Sodium Bile acid symporter family n=1 Tax=Actinidia rufa TaxID=165716 RepID=A0A7J0GK73_9ERIC|nr:sodium Bile acid symporter family [Actinidia rufa]
MKDPVYLNLDVSYDASRMRNFAFEHPSISGFPNAVDCAGKANLLSNGLNTCASGFFDYPLGCSFKSCQCPRLSAVSGGSKSVFAKRENVTALLLVASQKTLPVMAAVVEQLGGALGESGLLILPCVAAHLNQIIMDSFFVNFWLQNEQSSNQAKVA